MVDFSVIRSLIHLDRNEGFDLAEIQNAAERAGPIPGLLAEYYMQLGNIREINQNGKLLLLSPDKLRFEDSHLVFYLDSRILTCRWGISEPDALQADPPVYVSIGGGSWRKETSTLYEFLCAMAHLQAASGLEYSSGLKMLSHGEANTVRRAYMKKNFLLYCRMEAEFYGNSNSVIALIKNRNLYDMIYASFSSGQYDILDISLSPIGKAYQREPWLPKIMF